MQDRQVYKREMRQLCEKHGLDYENFLFDCGPSYNKKKGRYTHDTSRQNPTGESTAKYAVKFFYDDNIFLVWEKTNKQVFFSAAYADVKGAIDAGKSFIQKGDQYIAWGLETVQVLSPEEFEKFLITLTNKGDAK